MWSSWKGKPLPPPPPEGGTCALSVFLVSFIYFRSFNPVWPAVPTGKQTNYAAAASFEISAAAFFACSPSNCSTFLDTLNIIPIDKHVNKKLLPPMLTNGNVTPVLGNTFTFTPILVIACITSVKLNASARNAPKAKGHFWYNLIQRYKNRR